MQPDELEARILESFPDADLDVTGESCDFTVAIISASFENLSLMQRQQQVLALFEQELKSGQLHALSIKAWTPAQFAARQNTHLVQLEC